MDIFKNLLNKGMRSFDKLAHHDLFNLNSDPALRNLHNLVKLSVNPGHCFTFGIDVLERNIGGKIYRL